MFNEIKKDIVKMGLTILKESFVIGTWGNVSVKIPKKNYFAITPSGMDYSKIKTEDIVILDFDGKIIEGDRIPSTEWQLHAEIYKKREDVSSIIHTHSLYASAMASARKPIPPTMEDLVCVVGGGVNVANYALPGSKELADNAVIALENKFCVLLANHGVICVGKTLPDAFKVCKITEKTAQITLLAENMGGAVSLSKNDCNEMHKFYKECYGKDNFKQQKSNQKTLREPMNGLTHFIGVLLSITALVVLVTFAGMEGKVRHIVSFSLYGTSLILLYLFSTLYHWLPLTERGIKKMRKVDHMMIFILIAGSYTPICLVPLKGAWGWSIFGVIWGFAISGFFLKLLWMNMPRALYVSIYIVMGWIALIVVYPLSKVFANGGLWWLFIGGVIYTLGAVIYVKKKPNPFPDFFGFHEIWHIFVMLGSAAHFWMMFKYVLPMP